MRPTDFFLPRRGVSLVELLVVMAIISLVMSMLLVGLAKIYHIVEGFRG